MTARLMLEPIVNQEELVAVQVLQMVALAECLVVASEGLHSVVMAAWVVVVEHPMEVQVVKEEMQVQQICSL